MPTTLPGLPASTEPLPLGVAGSRLVDDVLRPDRIVLCISAERFVTFLPGWGEFYPMVDVGVTKSRFGRHELL